MRVLQPQLWPLTDLQVARADCQDEGRKYLLLQILKCQEQLSSNTLSCSVRSRCWLYLTVCTIYWV